MSEAVTALGGATSQGIVTVTESALQGMITLRGDLGSTALQSAVSDVVGHQVPTPRGVLGTPGAGVVWMSPDEVLVLCPYAEAATKALALSQALAGTHALVANVSDARAVFEIRGAGVRDIMAKIAPVDMSPAAFPVGMVRRTRLAQVAAAFWLEDDHSLRVICFRSVAQYVFDLLRTVSADGSEVDYF